MKRAARQASHVTLENQVSCVQRSSPSEENRHVAITSPEGALHPTHHHVCLKPPCSNALTPLPCPFPRWNEMNSFLSFLFPNFLFSFFATSFPFGPFVTTQSRWPDQGPKALPSYTAFWPATDSSISWSSWSSDPSFCVHS